MRQTTSRKNLISLFDILAAAVWPRRSRQDEVGSPCHPDNQKSRGAGFGMPESRAPDLLFQLSLVICPLH